MSPTTACSYLFTRLLNEKVEFFKIVWKESDSGLVRVQLRELWFKILIQYRYDPESGVGAETYSGSSSGTCSGQNFQLLAAPAPQHCFLTIKLVHLL